MAILLISSIIVGAKIKGKSFLLGGFFLNVRLSSSLSLMSAG